MIRIGINGFGRIGRAFFRAALKDGELEIIAINDLGDLENLAYLLRYDSVYRNFPGTVGIEGGALVVDGKRITFLQEKEPGKLPWKDVGVDVVVESTGIFDTYEKANAHIEAGAKRVVISAPVKEDPSTPFETAQGKSLGTSVPNGATVLVGVNEEKLSTCRVTSNASCTTNAASPIIAILDEKLGIEKALLNTTHSYTATQSIVDGPVKGNDFRRGRAAAEKMSPSTTGAAIAVTKAYTGLAGKFDGIAVRVPTPAGSIADITFLAKRDTTVEEINKILEDASKEERWKGIFMVTKEPLVSSDIIGSAYASVADLALTKVVGGNLVKVMIWYDNEMGYAHTLVRHVKAAGKH